MKQLVQLQKNKAEFDKLGIQMISVFREEKDGPAGAKKTTNTTGFSPILIDTPADKTKAYSQEGFITYLIGKDGTHLGRTHGNEKESPLCRSDYRQSERSLRLSGVRLSGEFSRGEDLLTKVFLRPCMNRNDLTAQASESR